MLESFVATILLTLGLYLAVGLIVALWLHSGPLRRIDPTVGSTSVGFRIAITPGMMALWPVLLRRLVQARRGQVLPAQPDRPVSARRIRSLHGIYVQIVTVAAPIVMAAAMGSRPSAPVNPEPLPAQIAEPARVVRATAPFADRAIAAVVRTDASETHYELELILNERLAMRNPMLFWEPDVSTDESPRAAEFLGALGESGSYRFAAPSALGRGEGRLVIRSIADDVTIVADHAKEG